MWTACVEGTKAGIRHRRPGHWLSAEPRVRARSTPAAPVLLVTHHAMLALARAAARASSSRRGARGDGPADAGHVADDEGGRHRRLEAQGGRRLFRGRRPARDCACAGLQSRRTPDERAQETDKATIDVEAQDDGVLGKILVRAPP
jgi:hypothetical protein